MLAGDVRWMREKWRELMVKFYGQDPPLAPPPRRNLLGWTTSWPRCVSASK